MRARGLSLLLALLTLPRVAHAEGERGNKHVDLDDDDDPAAQETEDEPEQKSTKVRRNSPAMMYTGIALTCLGGGGVIAAPILYARGDKINDSSWKAASAISGLSGLIVLAVGIPLIIVGARRVDGDEDAHFAPQVWVGGDGMGMAWAF